MPSSRGVEVRLHDATLQRGGRRILRRIRWHIRPGDRWVLVGANGAGKTQLLKLVAGAVWPDPSPRAVRRYRCSGAWHDQPLDCAGEIAYLGPERQDRYERHGWNFTVRAVVGTGCTRTDIPDGPLSAPDRRRVAALLATLGLRPLASRRFLTLSYGQRRLVLFARALATRPKLLLLDELLGGVDAGNRARLLRWFDGPGRRASWVLATHRPDEAPRGATGLLQLCDGQLRRLARPAATAPSAATARPAVAHRAPRVARRRSPVLVAVEHASIFIDWQPVLRDISCTVRAGDCWVVHGANGAGKTTLLRAIWGDFPAARGGRIRRRGIDPGVPLESFQRRCGFVAPHQHSQQPTSATALDVVVSGLRGSVGLDVPPRRAELRRARAVLGSLALGARATDAFHSLSYGTARRVLLARALAGRPRLLLLDEVCAGLDPAQRRILRADIDRLLGDGLTVIMSAHHRDEWPIGTTHELELAAGQAVHAGAIRD